MKVTVYVSPKSTVADPQGAAVEHAMKSLGHESVEGVRVGKTVTFEMEVRLSEQSLISCVMDCLVTRSSKTFVTRSKRVKIFRYIQSGKMGFGRFDNGETPFLSCKRRW